MNPLTAGLRPVHPAELLREDILPTTGMDHEQLGLALGLDRTALYALLAEEAPVTPAIAERLAGLFGGDDQVWLRIQPAFDCPTGERAQPEPRLDDPDSPELTAEDVQRVRPTSAVLGKSVANALQGDARPAPKKAPSPS
ncbi:MAG: HigA family addiction module antitoxin [Pacificimonas sp.]|jgi:addiction module HigA family antidote|nr:HigA family addiction module antitoxin [Pacificimonas sp.]